MPNKYIQNNYCILLGIFSPPLIASEWAEMLHRLCIWLAQNTLKAMSVSNGPELLCEEQEAAGQNKMEPHAHNIIWADKQQEMISKQERLHKTIRIISFAEKKKFTDIIIVQGRQKAAGIAVYAQQLNERLQTFQKASFPFK